MCEAKLINTPRLKNSCIANQQTKVLRTSTEAQNAHRLDSTGQEQRGNKAKAGTKMKKGDRELQALSIQSTQKWPPIHQNNTKVTLSKYPTTPTAEKLHGVGRIRAFVRAFTLQNTCRLFNAG